MKIMTQFNWKSNGLIYDKTITIYIYIYDRHEPTATTELHAPDVGQALKTT